jgi:hypothetical protein
METTDLASSIGLGTRQEAAFKGMPLTNFANKEYQINANNARLETERQRKEAELEKQLMSKINVTGKFDKISAPKIQKAYVDMVMNKGYKNPQALYDFDVQKQNEELASAARKEQADLLNKTDLLIDPKVKTALINHDVKQLEMLSQNPTSGIIKDERLPDTYTLAPEARIPRVDNITVVTKKFVPTDEANLDRSQTKLLKTVGGKKIYGTPVKESVLNQAAVEVMSNPVYAANWAKTHEGEIQKSVDSGVPLQQALINSFKDKNRFVEVDKETVDKGGSSVSRTYIGQGGLVESNGIRMKPDPNKAGFINVNKIVKEGKDPEILSATLIDKNGTPHNFAKIEGFYKVGDDNYRVVGSVNKGGEADELTASNISAEQLSKSVGMSKDALDNIKMAFDADKEEAIRKAYLESQGLGYESEYSQGAKAGLKVYNEIFKGDQLGEPTYQSKAANEWYKNKTKTAAPQAQQGKQAKKVEGKKDNNL